MYALDGTKMQEILAEIQDFQYHGTALAELLEPVMKKIEMSDYMSAADAVQGIREALKQEGGGEA